MSQFNKTPIEDNKCTEKGTAMSKIQLYFNRQLMKKAIATILLVSGFILIMSCEDIGDNNQPPFKISFQRTFGTDWYDYGWAVDQALDSGFILTGRKEYRENNSRDMILIKTDKNGFGQWEKTLGGAQNDEGLDVISTEDGGFLTVGYSWSFGNGQQIYAVKTDIEGNEEWQKVYGGTNREVGHSIIQSRDGSYIIVGQTNSPGISHGNDDVWLQKIDGEGNLIWQQAYGEVNHEVGYGVVELRDGGFLVIGYKEFYSAAGKDILLIKTDSDGNELWTKTFGSDGVHEEIGYSITKMGVNGYLLCAATNARENGWYDPRTIKIDFDGNVAWDYTYTGSGLPHTRWVATPTFDGGAAIVGTTNYFQSPGSDEDIYMLKIDSNGQIQWDRSFGGGQADWGWSIVETVSHDFVIVGSTKSYGNGLYDIILLATDENGN